MTKPTPDDVRAMRTRHGLTRNEAADLVHTMPRTWKAWETHGSEGRPINLAAWELFMLKLGEHPHCSLVQAG